MTNDPAVLQDDYDVGNKQSNNETVSNEDKLELYRLLGEGYKAMQVGRESSLEEVVDRLQRSKEERA